MPVELARKLVSQIRHWVETDRHLLLLPTRVVELAGHLARSGASDDAIELARSLLALSVDEDIIGQRIREFRTMTSSTCCKISPSRSSPQRRMPHCASSSTCLTMH